MNKYLIQKKSKIIYILLGIFLVFSIFPNVVVADENTQQIPTSAASSPIKLLSKADILLDAKTGNILYENNSSEKLYPASTTKLMTAILTVENCQMTDTVTIKSEWLKRYSS